ncbi:hypothetical protein N476_18670 [Pseudoalteromonas luteoviolacea H33]|uniref:Uncharacterized protein n=1 Tax=Pseudoalteromonas luteoviolacea H33 TaxID=1365251 RepID=A0A167E005_9GAMM|nr:hypothetical protein N476_18670 [Pseudoalteromonas luteoviolacea H33]KZN77842.1 hypothetical protein N477_01125 [Pseudoalteromonas luteoviolacea H33-S]
MTHTLLSGWFSHKVSAFKLGKPVMNYVSDLNFCISCFFKMLTSACDIYI